MAANFRICGLFSFTYNPSHYMDESNDTLSDFIDMYQVYPGIRKVKNVFLHLQAGDGFIINCTITEFTAPRSHASNGYNQAAPGVRNGVHAGCLL